MSADLATRGAGRHPLTKRRERLGGRTTWGRRVWCWRWRQGGWEAGEVKLVGEDDDEDGGGVGGAGGIADSFNHTSGPRQFTSFCHQVCQESRTGRELRGRPPGGSGRTAGKCVQRKPWGWRGLWYFDWVRAALLMCEAKSQYESWQERRTGTEPPRDADSRSHERMRRMSTDRGEGGERARDQLHRCSFLPARAAPAGEEGMAANATFCQTDITSDSGDNQQHARKCGNLLSI